MEGDAGIEGISMVEPFHGAELGHGLLQPPRVFTIGFPQPLHPRRVLLTKLEQLAIEELWLDMQFEAQRHEGTGVERLHAYRLREVELQEQQPVIIIPKGMSCHICPSLFYYSAKVMIFEYITKFIDIKKTQAKSLGLRL